MKKGRHSVGVARQYTGTAGRVENSQVGVFLAYAGRFGQALIDRRLYLPRDWAADGARRAKTSVPEEVAFATKPALAREMIGDALDTGMPCAFVLADTVYGSDSRLRRMLEERGQSYVLAVRSNHSLRFLTPAGLIETDPATIADDLEDEAWTSHAAGEGSKGPWLYDWARIAMPWPCREDRERWLLVRRSRNDPHKRAQFIGCSQGAVSTRIRALEQQLGTRLFHRARFNVRLTPTGEELLPKIRFFLDQHDRLFLNARALTVTGPVRVGAVEGFGAGLLAEFPQRVCKQYPAVELEVVCDLSAGLRQALKAGRLDLALLVQAEEIPSATMLSHPRLQWVGAPDFTFREDGPIPFAGYSEGCPVRAAALAALKDRGVACRVALTSWNDRVLDRAVRSGWAYSATIRMIPRATNRMRFAARAAVG